MSTLYEISKDFPNHSDQHTEIGRNRSTEKVEEAVGFGGSIENDLGLMRHIVSLTEIIVMRYT